MKTIPMLMLALTLAVPSSRTLAQPVITQQPLNQTNIAGTSASFSIVASGTPPLSYQWRAYTSSSTFTNVPAATEPTLTLTNVQPTSRLFGVVVTEGGGLSVTSSLASLTVYRPPFITRQPALLPVANSLAVVGATAQLSLLVLGTAPLRFQWRFNDVDLVGKTNSRLTLTNLSLEQAGGYSIRVTNDYGLVLSQTVPLTVIPDPFSKITSGSIVTDRTATRGLAWGDYDGDGFIDLVVTAVGDPNTNVFLYHNERDGTFSRVKNSPVTSPLGDWRGASWGDFDNDGGLDLAIVNRSGTNLLFRNNGQGGFIEVKGSALTSDVGNSRSVSWVDYDNDGYIDLFRTIGGGLVAGDEVNRLYHNNHDGTFTRVTQGSLVTDTDPNISGPFGAAISLGAAWADYNNDGRQDLFVAVAGAPRSRLYRNEGSGVFIRTDTEVFRPIGLDSGGTMADWGDYDNDGDPDLFISSTGGDNTNPWPNGLLRNDGSLGFTVITNLPANDLENEGGASWGCKWGDYDNDGWLDLFVANANTAHNNFLYHNNQDGTFTKVTGSTVNLDGWTSWSCAWGDYDNDGFMDLFVSTGFDSYEPNLLYHNTGNANHWLKLQLIGTRSNRSGIGAKVRVQATINGRTFSQLREVSGGDGYSGQNDMRPNFGLGDATNIDLVRVEWPSGTVQELRNIAANQILTITELGGEPTLAATKTVGGFTLTLTGKQGSLYEIEQSTTLKDWFGGSLTVTPTNAEGVVTFSAPGSPQDPVQFFRARLR